MIEILNEKIDNKTSVALGFFDGLHIAHMAVINRIANKKNSCVLTFKTKGFSDKTLISDETKMNILSDHKIEYIKFLDFNVVKDMSPECFVKEILKEQLNAQFVVCGYNFRFGKKAMGTTDDLTSLCSKYGIETEIIGELDFDGEAVSTTRIKALLRDGNIVEANKLLGYRYFIEDKVIHGKQLGRKYDFPTANQKIKNGRFIPKLGVYASIVSFDGKSYTGVTNIGTKPTVSEDKTVISETCLLDYSGDLYEKVIRVEFIEFLREEKKFTDVSSLAGQISNDKISAMKLLTEGGYNG